MSDVFVKPGASAVMRELGLLVDGPVQWSRPVPSRAPGVFVVELPGGAAQAPIDGHAITRWLGRMPDLLLDGERPTAQQLGRRIAQFWLPDEPILFVGRSTQRLGARVAAMYATPLGDERPYSAANWLKTLAVLPRLRLWWAETDAHEEYLDAVLSGVTERNGGGLPFANLVASSGDRRTHGLANFARQPEAAQPTTQTRPATSPTRRRATSAAGRAPRRQPIRPPKAHRPTPDPVYVSQDGHDQLVAELEDLRTNTRPKVIERVAAARAHGDLKENAEYEYARKEQSFVEGRIQTLEATLKQAQVVDSSAASENVRVGSTVVVESEGEQVTFVIVGSSESNPAAGRISYSSPVGQALMGARAGDEVTAVLPGRSLSYRVREVH